MCEVMTDAHAPRRQSTRSPSATSTPPPRSTRCMATYIGLPGHDDRLPDLSTRTGYAAAVASCARRRCASWPRRTPGGRERPGDDRRAARAARACDERAARPRRGGVRAQQHRLAGAGRARRVRPDADRAPSSDWAIGAAPAGRAAGRDRRLHRLAAATPPRAGTCAPARQVEVGDQAVRRQRRPGRLLRPMGAHAPRPATATLPDVAARRPGPRRGAARATAYAAAARLPARRAARRRRRSATRSGASATPATRGSFLGATVDLDETYAWGQEELARIVAEMQQTAERIKPGRVASPRRSSCWTPTRPASCDGTDALQAWMQEKSDAAVDALAGTHFDIPEPIRRLECRIAPTHTGVIYYTGPCDDLSPVRAGCGGRCRRASPSSPPGAS